MKYKKKPVVIDAVQWTGENFQELMTLDGFNFNEAARYDFDACELLIHTLEGDLRADIGDYIIRGVHGEFYPCKPDIFRETYDDAEGAEDQSEGLHVYCVFPVTDGEPEKKDGRICIVERREADDGSDVMSRRADVTEEAIAAVRDYLFDVVAENDGRQRGYRWLMRDGRVLTLLLDIGEAADGSRVIGPEGTEENADEQPGQ